MADDRFRDWTVIVYPDSAPDNWIDILNNEHLCFGVSPLHDSDLNGDDTEKKSHWHLYLKFSGKKSYNQILELIKPLNCTIPKPVKNPVGMVRYFVHADNPEKTQYLIDDIRSFGGFESFVDDVFKMRTSDVNFTMNQIQDWIVEHQICEYEDLWTFSADMPTWRYVLNMYNCNSIFRLLNSIRYRKEHFNVRNSH